MTRATATLTSTGNVIFRLHPSPELLAAWETTIPESERSLDHQRGRYWFSAEYVDLALGLAERFLDIELVNGPYSRSSLCPCQGALHHVRRLAGRAA